MIISRTPFRISFFGGGTDYPAWYRQHGGAVLAAAINKYCYISCRWLPPFFEYRSRILYSKVECVKDLTEIEHPAVRETLRYLGIEQGVEIHHDADLPARTGLGSSSTFTVGLLHVLRAMKGEVASRKQLAEDAFRLEHEIMKETVGAQDQTIAAYGGFNRVHFRRDGGIDVAPVTLPGTRLDELQSHLMLVFTGFTRWASEIAAEQARHTGERGAELRAIQAMVDEGLHILSSGADIRDFGTLLHEGWMLKKRLSDRISTPQIDAWYETARAAGALGGKVLGAGGGGFMLFFAPPERHREITDRLGLMSVPFRFASTGSQIIFYDPEQ